MSREEIPGVESAAEPLGDSTASECMQNAVLCGGLALVTCSAPSFRHTLGSTSTREVNVNKADRATLTRTFRENGCQPCSSRVPQGDILSRPCTFSCLASVFDDEMLYMFVVNVHSALGNDGGLRQLAHVAWLKSVACALTLIARWFTYGLGFGYETSQNNCYI